jgi:hypothetical protein
LERKSEDVLITAFFGKLPNMLAHREGRVHGGGRIA